LFIGVAMKPFTSSGPSSALDADADSTSFSFCFPEPAAPHPWFDGSSFKSIAGKTRAALVVGEDGVFGDGGI
jgi:hypothetical protein